MSERLDLFPTPIITATPPEFEALNEQLLAAIHEHRASNETVERSNIGGWHSDIDMAHWAGDPAIRLAEFAIEQVSAHMVDIASAGKRKFTWGFDMWANINSPGNANQLHCHPGSYWSAVYYPDPGGAEQKGNGGELVLEDPRYPMAYSTVPDLVLRMADREPMHSQFAIRPQAGMLVMFPSWLRHSVRPHAGDRDRVSIAINLLLVGAVPDESAANS